MFRPSKGEEGHGLRHDDVAVQQLPHEVEALEDVRARLAVGHDLEVDASTASILPSPARWQTPARHVRDLGDISIVLERRSSAAQREVGARRQPCPSACQLLQWRSRMPGCAAPHEGMMGMNSISCFTVFEISSRPSRPAKALTSLNMLREALPAPSLLRIELDNDPANRSLAFQLAAVQRGRTAGPLITRPSCSSRSAGCPGCLALVEEGLARHP